MIDCHCHLSEPDYQKDRDEVIEKCKQKLDAVITCCAHPHDFDLTMELIEKHKNFIFATVGIHPIHIEEIADEDKYEFLDLIRRNSDKFVGIGEVGFDFHWAKERKSRERQKKFFVEHIQLAKELKKPLVIHSRDAYQDSIELLEQENAEKVLMHMFGAHHLLKRVIDNGWYISTNTILLRSKKHKKIIRDTPLDRIMTETDSPWLDPNGGRNTPLNVKVVIEKISKIKKISVEKVDRITTDNALHFFKLKGLTNQ